MNPHFILLDANSLGMTAAARFHLQRRGAPDSGRRPAWATKGGFPNGAVHGMVDSLLLALRTVIETQPGRMPFPILLWDGRAQWRYDLYPAYKPRPKDPEYLSMKDKYKQQVPILRALWHYVGLPQVIAVDEEADDVAGQLAPRLARHGPVTLVSKDGDWVQRVAPGVTVYVHGEHARFIGVADLPTLGDGGKFGYADVRAYLQAKALAGDPSDGIDGVDKVGMQTAAKLLAEFGTVEAFWAAVDSGQMVPKGVIQTRLASTETRSLFARNLRLMDWSCAPPLQPSTFLWVGKADPGEVAKIMAELELKVAGERLAAYRPLDYHASLAAANHPLHLALEEAQWEEAA